MTHKSTKNKIINDFINNPKDEKYKELLKVLFLDNEKVIINSITDELIQQNIEYVFNEYSHRDYFYKREWEKDVVKFIRNNWDKLKCKNDVEKSYIKEVGRLRNEIKVLEGKLKDISKIVETYHD